MAPPPRLLLCGDVLGHLNQLSKRLQSVNKSSGPFDAVLCTGQFFPESDDVKEIEDYISGRCSLPIPTYFTGDYGFSAARFLSAKSRGGGFTMDPVQICTNLHWLRGSGKFTLHGLSVVYLSGHNKSSEEPHGSGIGWYSEDDVGALRALAEEPGVVDIFMTNEWPAGVWNLSKNVLPPALLSDSSGTDLVVAQLAKEIKPRYHIAGSRRIFYAREPYVNSEAAHVTRFIGLASVGNKDKHKFIHAISPTPASAMSAEELHAKPPDTTLSPYLVAFSHTDTGKEAAKRSASNDDADAQYWRYDTTKKRQRQGGNPEKLCFKFTSTGTCPHGENCSFRHDTEAMAQYKRSVCFDFLNKGQCERGPDCMFVHSLVEEGDERSHKAVTYGKKSSERNCWFCLSSPNVESHLILSVGESYYCALAKGPLVQDHVLVIPIDHHPNTLMMSSEADVELGMYKDALTMYFKKQGKAVVFYEWIFQRSHANLQVVPIPMSKAADARRIFNLAAKQLGFEFEVVSKSSDNVQGRNALKSYFDGKANLFYVELPDGTILSYAADDKEKLPVQFGREVLAGLLKVADRADWRNCKLSKEEEMQMVESFKKGFEEFDPANR